MSKAKVIVIYQGAEMTLAEAIARSGSTLDSRTVLKRLQGGSPLLRALSLPSAANARHRRADGVRPLSMERHADG